MSTDMDKLRNPRLTPAQITAFKAVTARLKRRGTKCIKDTVLRRELEAHPSLLKAYVQHAEKFDVSN